MKSISIIGHVGQNATQKKLDSGKSVLNFNCAVYDGKDDKGEPKTLWFACRMFFQSDDSAAKMQLRLISGTYIYVTGQPGLSIYERQDGSPGGEIVITVDSVNFLKQSNGYE